VDLLGKILVLRNEGVPFLGIIIGLKIALFHKKVTFGRKNITFGRKRSLSAGRVWCTPRIRP
jgi:hypothetical protein